MKDTIKIVKQETRYILSDKNGYCISVSVSGDGTAFSIFRKDYFNEPFYFKNSSEETIKAIANLLLEVIKLK